MLKGWMDDSRRDAIWSVGGYVGGQFHWEHFEQHWPEVLKATGVPYFHMKEMANPNGVYAKWHPPEAHQEEVAAFMKGLVKVINESFLYGILSTVRVNDLDRFNAEKELSLEPYPLAAYGCMLLAARHVPPGTPIELVFDRVEQARSKLDKAEGYAKTDCYWRETCNSIVTSVVERGVVLEELPAMQAADFVAWEFRKHQERIDAWYAQGNIPADIDEAWASLENWILKNFGSHEAVARKSAAALIEGGRFGNLVWDYRTLHEVHELRRGLW